MLEAIEPMRFMVLFSRLPVLPLARFTRLRNPGVQFLIIIIMKPMIHPALPFSRVRYDYDITLGGYCSELDLSWDQGKFP